MVSAYRITRERVGYAVAVSRSEQDLFGSGFAVTLCVAQQSHAGCAPQGGWRYG
jgi:hypothetical protein